MERISPHVNFKLYFSLFQFLGFGGFGACGFLSSERLAICLKILSVKDLRDIFNSLKS